MTDQQGEHEQEALRRARESTEEALAAAETARDQVAAAEEQASQTHSKDDLESTRGLDWHSASGRGDDPGFESIDMGGGGGSSAGGTTDD